MSQKELKELMELAETLKNNVTKEEALSSFMAAGILDENLHCTEPYKELEEAQDLKR